jgi:predicted transcriptional regulator
MDKRRNKMSKIKIENYYVVPGWARLVLGLENSELMVFSIIYGFSQTEGSMFTGSIDYLAEWIAGSRSTVFNALAQLREKNFIIKYKVTNGENIYNAYVYNKELISNMIDNYNEKLSEESNKTTLIIEKLEPKNSRKNVLNNVLTNDEINNKINVETVQNLDPNVQKLNPNIQKLNPNIQNLDVTIQNPDIIYNNINNIKNNNIKYTSLADSAFSSKPFSDRNFSNNFENENENCLSGKKDRKATRKMDSFSHIRTKELGAADARVGVEDLIGEKLINLDNKLAAENRRKKQLAAENEPTVEEKTNMRIKKARMKEAQERTSNAELLEALGNFIEAYQFSHNKLSKPAWKLILDELFSYGSDESELVKHVNHSIASGYRKIYQYTKFNNKDFDNTRGRKVEKALHELTQEEKDEFDKTLARDENGNLIVF